MHNVLQSSFFLALRYLRGDSATPLLYVSIRGSPVSSGPFNLGYRAFLVPCAWRACASVVGTSFGSVATGRSWIVLPHVRIIDKAQGTRTSDLGVKS